MSTKNNIAARIEAQLNAAADARADLAEEPGAAGKSESLRAWQAARLTRTHADLLESPRYAATAQFFLTDIYGPKDLSRHEAAVRRIQPLMISVLPAAGLETVADAFELNALSESLDAAMLEELGDKISGLTEADYAAAYRAVGRRADRERQIELILHLGQSLDRLTRKPFLGATLAMMRGPAAAAGLLELQNFLERGYTAFRQMKGADEFLETITSRERALLDTWLAGDRTVPPDAA
ncbi:MAG: FFLEELY motif protein [Rhodomicrobium sp.]